MQYAVFKIHGMISVDIEFNSDSNLTLNCTTHGRVEFRNLVRINRMISYNGTDISQSENIQETTRGKDRVRH